MFTVLFCMISLAVDSGSIFVLGCLSVCPSVCLFLVILCSAFCNLVFVIFYLFGPPA